MGDSKSNTEKVEAMGVIIHMSGWSEELALIHGIFERWHTGGSWKFRGNVSRRVAGQLQVFAPDSSLLQFDEVLYLASRFLEF